LSAARLSGFVRGLPVREDLGDQIEFFVVRGLFQRAQVGREPEVLLRFDLAEDAHAGWS